MVERIDELTGLPTTRTGVVPRKPGALGPGAELGYAHYKGLGVVCGLVISEECPCGGKWEVWRDDGRDTYAFRHLPVEGKVYARVFDAHRYPRMHGVGETIGYLTRTVLHPRNAPTPGKAGR